MADFKSKSTNVDVNKISELERIGIEERQENLEKSVYGYTRESEYNAEHPNAKSDGDKRGKGHNDSSYDYLLPHEGLKTTKLMTIDTINGGSSVDIAAREQEYRRRLYSSANEYGVNSVLVGIKEDEGQFKVTDLKYNKL